MQWVSPLRRTPEERALSRRLKSWIQLNVIAAASEFFKAIARGYRAWRDQYSAARPPSSPKGANSPRSGLSSPRADFRRPILTAPREASLNEVVVFVPGRGEDPEGSLPDSRLRKAHLPSSGLWTVPACTVAAQAGEDSAQEPSLADETSRILARSCAVPDWQAPRHGGREAAIAGKC